MVTIDRTNPVPYYHQLKEGLREEIRSGRLRSGEKLPPERQLAEQHGISLITVRQALSRLADEGLLLRERGRGTFVTRAPLEFDLTSVRSFTEEMRRRGLEPGARVLYCAVEPAPPNVAERLGLARDASVVQLRRLRLADGAPMALETNYLPAALVPGLVELDLTGSLFTLLQARYGLIATQSIATLQAVPLYGEEARLLGLEEPGAGLRAEAVTYAQNGRPIDLGRSTFRGDRYILTVQASRRPW